MEKNGTGNNVEETENIKNRKNQNKVSHEEKGKTSNEEKKKPYIVPNFELQPTPIESMYRQIKENIDLPLCCLTFLMFLILMIVFYKFEKEARAEEISLSD